MDEFENNGFSPEAEQPVYNPEISEEPVCNSEIPEEPVSSPEVQAQPEEAAAEPYYGRGAGRKESPFADSPYVMYHQPQSTEHTAVIKPKKKKRAVPGFWKKAIAFVLLLTLVVGSCTITASLVSEHWEEEMEEMEQDFSQKLDKMQKQIDNASNKQAAISSSIPAGEMLSPSQLYAYNVDSVVAITATVQSTMYGQTAEGTSAGSGFILTEDGYVITNCHVVDGGKDINVITHDGTEYAATLVGSDANNDIAVLKVDATGLPTAAIGSSDALAIGDMVVAIGNPLGTLSSTQTVGYVSGKDRDVTTDGSIISMIQTDAAINSGNSGGPLFNMAGQVVGITTAKYSGTSTSGATIEGIGFAIPIDDVMPMISDLMDYGYVTGAYMGITVSNTDEESASMFGLPTGAYVMSVENGGSADRAGIQAKDIIIDLGGYKVTGITTLTRALRNFKAGDTTTVTVIRSGGEMTLDITLDEKPQAQPATSVLPESSPNMPQEGNPNEWYDYFRRYFGG